MPPDIVVPSQPHELCYCRSGKIYANCHLPLDSLKDHRYLGAARTFYINQWRANAAHHEKQGHYLWMTEQVAPFHPDSIFDIGLGTGAGVKALVQRLAPKRVVTIEENPGFIADAQKSLRRLAPVGLVRRMKPMLLSGRHYDEDFCDRPIPAAEGVTIVETDLLLDDSLAGRLTDLGPFDLVTVWLTGTHNARQYCASLLQRYSIANTAEYRLSIQNLAYELADQLLRPGGHLHIVDRILIPEDAEVRQRSLDEVVRAHREQAEPTTLRFEAMSYIKHAESDSQQRITLQTRDEKGTEIVSDEAVGLISVLFVKP